MSTEQTTPVTSSEKLATIVRVSAINSIPDADKIVAVLMEDNAWQVVAPKDSFKVGDLGVFFVIDSIVDSSNPDLSFMAARKNLVWPVRMKKCLSQGLLIPVSALKYWGVEPGSVKQGDDVTERSKTTKRTRAEDLPNNPQAAGLFPSNIVSITDELNLLSNKKAFEELRGKAVTITLKMDGSSSTYLIKGGEFSPCSRRQSLKPDSINAWTRLAAKYGLPSLLSVHPSLVIQGEACGPNLNGNRLSLTQEELFVFDIFDQVKRTYFSIYELEAFCTSNGLKMAPVVWRGIFNFSSIDELVALSTQQKYGNGNPAEGVVIRADDKEWSHTLGKRLSVKVINPDYKS